MRERLNRWAYDMGTRFGLEYWLTRFAYKVAEIIGGKE